VSRASPADLQVDSASQLRGELGQIRALVEQLLVESRAARQPDIPRQVFDYYLQLIGAEVADEIARQIIQTITAELTPEQLHDSTLVRQRIARCIERMLPQAGPLELSPGQGPRIIALVGPTGVGKTTTIAKLAANFRLRQGRKVGLATIDTYRIAAVDQLRTYARIIDVPLHVVLTPQELQEAVAAMRDTDLILIDTTGRSPKDTARIEQLRQFLEAVRPDEVHLVLATTCGQKVMLEAAEQFGRVGVNRIIFTKLDEAVGFGVMLNVVRKLDKQLSYLTTGQAVPDDIEVAHGRRLAELILTGRLIAPTGTCA